jgi:hypothetical protein
VIDSSKHRHRTLCLGERGSGIGAPHLIGRLGQDPPVVRLWRVISGRREGESR